MSDGWLLSDLKSVPKNGLRVFSTFACGGGSSMGYKLAGYDVVGANDIDPQMMRHYEINLKPRSFYLCPVKDLVAKKFPGDFMDLDILDGSPPCSSFSVIGAGERLWGVEKKFREGQAKQVLDDLFFDFLDVAEKLKPKVIIAENVKGMIQSNAKGYVKMVFGRMRQIGYRPQLFLLDAADHGVPQKRERVFFLASRNDLNVDPIEIRSTTHRQTIGDACSKIVISEEEKKQLRATDLESMMWARTYLGQNFSSACQSSIGKGNLFGYYRLDPNHPAKTLTANDLHFHWDEPRRLSMAEKIRIGTFPDDYWFDTSASNASGRSLFRYIIGMSVPPRMMESISRQVLDQWLR